MVQSNETGDSMNYDLVRLNNNIVKRIEVNETYSFTLDELKGTDLLKLDNIKVEGEIIKNMINQ